MKYIEIKSEGYTFRYDFEPELSSDESFNSNIILPIESKSNSLQSLLICLDLLSCVFGKESVKSALKETNDSDF